MAIYGYCRVSTDDQAESGAGLAAHNVTLAVRGLVSRGEDVATFFADEGVSGAKGLEYRPALLDCLSILKPEDIIVVAKRDRIARDVVVSAMTEAAVGRKGARIVSAAGEGSDDDSPAGQLMRRLIDCFGEYERAVIASRTKAALGAKKARGERVGEIPYGYQMAADGVHLEPAPAEQAVVAEAQRLYAAGLSFRGVAAQLSRLGHLSRAGKPFAHPQIKNMLTAREAA